MPDKPEADCTLSPELMPLARRILAGDVVSEPWITHALCKLRLLDLEWQLDKRRMGMTDA